MNTDPTDLMDPHGLVCQTSAGRFFGLTRCERFVSFWEVSEMGEREMLHADITERIIKAYYRVYNKLGYGFLERVYENALVLACEDQDLNVEQQVRVDVYFEGCRVGVYRADLLVEKKVIVEIKAAAELCEEHEAQLINYLRATPIEVGLLLNFGKRPQYKRKLFTNDRKSGYLSAI